jgi:hypothetical protein
MTTQNSTNPIIEFVLMEKIRGSEQRAQEVAKYTLLK